MSNTKLYEHIISLRNAVLATMPEGQIPSDQALEAWPAKQQERIAELEEAAAMREVTVESQLARITELMTDPATLSARHAKALNEIDDNCAGSECRPDRCGSCEATKLKRILKGDE